LPIPASPAIFLCTNGKVLGLVPLVAMGAVALLLTFVPPLACSERFATITRSGSR
jgi:hypothetical protein